MSEEKKREDFVELLKRMKSDMNTPSVIGDTLDKVERLQKENQLLKEQINKNRELIQTSEETVKNQIEEKEKLKVNSNRAIEKLESEIKSSENVLLKKNEDLKIKEKQIFELKNQIEKISKKEDSTLLKSKLNELERRINQLSEENSELNKKLIEQKRDITVDYVVPVVEATTVAKKPDSSTPSFSTLEKLCQDLQSDLNKYKRTMDSIKAENIELKKVLQGKGLANEFKEIETLKNENSSLKADISRLEKSVEKKTVEVKLALESEDKIRNLQEQLKEKEKRIEELKETSLTEFKVSKGPMSSLVDDLQAKINKMKLTLNEKDQLIGELKAKLKQK